MRIQFLLTAFLLIGLTGCGGDDDTEGLGYIQFYNASSNSPALFLVIEKDNDDDYEKRIHGGVSYTQSSSYIEYAADTYDMDISWQDENDLDDLEIIYESPLTVSKDAMRLIVVSDEIDSPEVHFYDMEIIDDDNDEDDDLFNLRILNMHNGEDSVDIYLSESDETFEQAVLIGQYSYTEMSDNQKFDQDDYVFYITSSGSNDVIYQSEEISYQTVSQSIMVIRENNGPGSSPFSLDKLSESSAAKEYSDADAEAKFRLYNAIIEHELLPSYQGTFDLHLDGVDDSAEVSSLAQGKFSESYLTDFGDYAISLTLPNSTETIIDNHLLTLNVNSDKSVFFYLLEEEVDEDGDGDFDEDGDGFVDDWEITINSLVVDNSQSENIYTHQINTVNLIDEFSQVEVYFVLSNETIETTSSSVTARYTTPRAITLNNNSYNVYVIAEEDSSELILATLELTLDESSKDTFLILEESIDSSSGYKMTFRNQKN